MRLRATVRRVTGKTTHLHGVATEEGTLEVTKVFGIKTVEVVEQNGAYYLLRLDDKGRCVADTWHESVQGAKKQASFEFGIEEGDWKEIGSH